MNKTLIIIQREYLTRVRKKSFLIGTLLAPVLFIILILAPAWLNREMTEKVSVDLIGDQAIASQFQNRSDVEFRYSTASPSDAIQAVEKGGSNPVLLIPDTKGESLAGWKLYYHSEPTMKQLGEIERQTKAIAIDQRLKRLGFGDLAIEKIKTAPKFESVQVNASGKPTESGKSPLQMILGAALALMTYTLILAYGSQVLRGVKEEKSNHIADILMAMVKPSQLLAGKVLGVAATVLTQIGIWAVLLTLVGSLYVLFSGSNQSQELALPLSNVISPWLQSSNPIFILVGFLPLAILGYLLYASLFAAVGAATDLDTDVQQFTLPITAPLLIAIISMSTVIENPHSSLAFWLSHFPLTSPVVMVARLPFQPPLWEVALSILSLGLSFGGVIRFAGKIYRHGLLHRGAKSNYRMLWAWIRS